jgi:hypothetical protein
MLVLQTCWYALDLPKLRQTNDKKWKINDRQAKILL